MERPSLLVLATFLSRQHAGAAHATIDIVNTLVARDVIDLSVAAMEVQPGALNSSISVTRLARPPQRRAVWRVARAFRLGDARGSLRAVHLPVPDAVYTQSIEMGLAYRELFPFVPIIAHPGHVLAVREAIEESDLEQPWRAIDAWLAERIERASYRSRGWQHVVSTGMVGETRRRRFGLPEGFFKVQPLSVDTTRFGDRSARSATRAGLGVSPDACLIVSVARMVGWKNLSWVVRALATLPDSCHLVLVGDGPERGALEAAVPAESRARVHFRGHCDPVPYLAAGDVFALPSAIESFGVAYAEAMSMGLPCVGLRYNPPHILSSAEDVIVHGHAGFVVDNETEFREVLGKLAGDIRLRERAGTAARERAHALFSNDSYAAFLEGLLQQHSSLEVTMPAATN